MDDAVVRTIMRAELDRYRARPYEALVRLIGAEPFVVEIADAGVVYQVEIEVFWDAEPGGTLRVVGAVDAGGWRAIVPLCESFLKAPDGSFVDDTDT